MFKKPKWPLVLISAFAYVGIIDLYGEYIVSREVDGLLQASATLLVIFLTAGLIKLFYKYLKAFYESETKLPDNE